ncbi:MAG TPA: carotenoid 1,2-hydratase [Noviherbaspirillum sp.]|nr:carotenoid 1,2-hydratase [Noviherbaspirillum sp.]
MPLLNGLRVVPWMQLCIAALLTAMVAPAAAAGFAAVTPGKPLSFPRDFGAHPDFRTEWWYATGWLTLPDGKPLGFQVTFFRSATEHDRANPSRFAPHQIIIAHAALADPQHGRLIHDEKSARAGFGMAFAREGDTDVKLGDWRFVREADGRYRASIPARDFTLELSLLPTQPPMLQGERGYSRKGPQPQQASYYYSQPQLRVDGTVTRAGERLAVTGEAWLDHEWSTTVLDPSAEGWDWIGINLDGGGALVAFRIRTRDGGDLWAYAALRAPDGSVQQFGPEQVSFSPRRLWRSPRTDASYPVAYTVTAGPHTWQIDSLMDDQELDSRATTGAVYWEGAVTVSQDGRPVGRGYLEMTGYVSPIQL